jgi:hypothetical protein
MANIETGNVDAYVKQLLSEEFGYGAKEYNSSQSNIHSDGKTVSNAIQNIFKDRLNHNEKEA